MKRVHYNYLAAPNILTPIKIEEEKLDNQELNNTLQKLFPQKNERLREEFAVNAIPLYPAGPDELTLINEFFPRWTDAVLKVKEKLHLKNIYLIAMEQHWQDNNPEIQQLTAPNRDTESLLNLNLFQFYRLYHALEEGTILNSTLLTIYISRDEIFTLHVPVHTPLKKIIQETAPLKAYVEKNRLTTLYHPILKLKYDIEKDKIEENTGILTVRENQFELQAKPSLLFPFPYFNHKLSIVETVENGQSRPKSVVPCSNCLLCSLYCPAGLYPSHLYHHILKEKQEELEGLQIKSCIECGHCQLVCPSRLPLAAVISSALQEEMEESEESEG